ncbi:MAG: NADH-quinone oxidoreductase subunit NuoN [Gammaproteobacteria bacterium]|nr:NADH-quinone oxidoreductase subunit NuoN [Gammaproteobacteria bacterium]
MNDFELPNFALALPEMFLLGMTCLVLIVDLFLNEKNRVFTYLLAQLTLLGAVVITYYQAGIVSEISFTGSFIRDEMGDILKIFIYIITAVVFLYSRDYLRDRQQFKGEFYALGLFGVLGMMIMVSAHSFLTIYLGLELLSLSLYTMVALNRDSEASAEAAMKYFVLGAIASGMLLYGMSMIYGATGSLDIAEIGSYINENGISEDGKINIVLSFGLVFIVVGLAFKLGAVPFHMWVPDIYEGAQTPVTLYLGAAPKLAAFAMIMRILVEGMQPLVADWQMMLTALAVLSLAVGNIIAIAQTNMKRMLAYSTISHVGFLLLGIIAGNEDGYSASMFYVLIYALTSIGAFGMIILLSRSGFEADKLEDFKGLNERSRWYAFMMLLIMFSMAGVPPTVGFFAKLWVIKAVLDVDMAWLAISAVLFSVIGAYYYIRIIKLMYFDKAVDKAPIKAAVDMQFVISTNGLLMLVLGLFPGALVAVCQSVIN